MKVIGIIAEYNPFHNGHAYQIKKIKKEFQADYVVIAMSGDFVQRGTPAIIDKYARTQMALSAGADLVLELPVLWSTASAKRFATAGVTLFEKMGCVDGICFGAETDNLELLSKIADILDEEPEEYRLVLSQALKEGLSFPAARSQALCAYLGEDVSSILDSPNNILSIEYLRELKTRNSSIKPYLIKREGANYHEETISSSETAPASATAIRKELYSSELESLTNTMPDSSFTILKEYLATNALLQTNDFSNILGYKLLTTDVATLEKVADATADMANRISRFKMSFSTFKGFCEYCKSKDITFTRIRRVLLHLVLGITEEDYALGEALDYIPYLRILGFRKASSELLSELKVCAQVPVISKLADASTLLPANAMTILEKDIFSADLYEQVCATKSNRTSRSEFIRNIVRI